MNICPYQRTGVDIDIDKGCIIFILIMTFLFPEDIYRWLVSINIIPNLGEINDRNMVTLPVEYNVHFESGFNIAQIIKSIQLKNGEKISPDYDNILEEQGRTVKNSNWNFIWILFDQLRLQFDTRIKDLILQGENALIIEVIKQLYERDEHKNDKAIKEIVIKSKQQLRRQDKLKKGSKSATIDINKINLQKDPKQSESSLEFLILLLTQSLAMSVQEVLGLFTNQNKYLAHLLVKGINDDYKGIILFYTLLNKYSVKLKEFCDTDRKDAESCLYALKPGLISKNQRVSELCIEVLLKVGNIYDWFVSEHGKCNTTLFLGIKRHPHLLDLYWDLLLQIIQNEEMDFFTKHFKTCFRDNYQMIEVCNYLIRPLSQSYISQKLMDLGVLSQWLEIGLNLFDNPIDYKILSYKFLGHIMNYLPQLVEDTEESVIILKSGWRERKLTQFVPLFDELIIILQELAGDRNSMARKVYQIVIEIFEDVEDLDEKREIVVYYFHQVLPKFPKIPTQYFIEAYRTPTFKPYDSQLFKHSIQLCSDVQAATRIGQVLLKMFNQASVLNHQISPILYKICQQWYEQEKGKQFILHVIKQNLQCYCNIFINKKDPRLVKQQPAYFGVKGNSEKYSQEDEDGYVIKEYEEKVLMALIEKLIELIKKHGDQDCEKKVREEVLDSNAFIKKNNFKTGSKVLAQLMIKKLGLNKEDINLHEDDYRSRHSIQNLQESIVKKKGLNQSSMMVSSRYTGPDGLRKDFEEVTKKRKKEEEERRLAIEKKQRQSAYKKTLIKKEYEVSNLLRGFAHEAELKEDGFWERFKKEEVKELEVYPTEAMEGRDIEYIQNVFKKFHRLIRSLFLAYTSTMHEVRVKDSVSFGDHKKHKETINVVEMIKFLKDYKLFFLTSNVQIQQLIRDVNVKLLQKRETQDLDFSGFQQFIIQFCSVIYVKQHTINTKTTKGLQNIRKSLLHMSHLELVEEFFKYLKLVFIEKGEKTSLFDEPELAYFNESQVIAEFNKRLENDPDFILPEGYKKVTDKVITMKAEYSPQISIIPENYSDVYSILDEIFHDAFNFHLLEPISQKQLKVRVKPHAFANVKNKLMESTEAKPRALTSIIEKKASIPPVKMLEKRTLSFGMKLGLSYVSYKDKMLGEQVAYVVDDMLTAVEKNRTTIEKDKIVNDIVRRRQEMEVRERELEEERERQRKSRKGHLDKVKKQLNDKRQGQKKVEQEKKKVEKSEQHKKKKEDEEKFKEYIKKKQEDQKKKEEDKKQKRKSEQKKTKEDKKKKKEEFNSFNTKQIEKYQKDFNEEVEKKKKNIERYEEDKKKEEELRTKLRSVIQEKDKKIIEIKQKNEEEIYQLLHSEPIQKIYKQFQPNLRALYAFLIKNTFLSLTERKHNNQIVIEQWHHFNLTFQLTPLIISAKQLIFIFRALTKDKQWNKDYYSGLNYQQFCQALFRVAILHKSIFNKLSEKIKEQQMTAKEIDDVVQKDIEEKEKNEFDEPKEIDVKGLMKQGDINKSIFHHYGSMSKVSDQTLQALIYYLKVPKDKKGQDKRFREIETSKIKYNIGMTQQLKEKLTQEYTFESPPKKKTKKQEPVNLEQSVEDPQKEQV